jgi:hypothetical protein
MCKTERNPFMRYIFSMLLLIFTLTACGTNNATTPTAPSEQGNTATQEVESPANDPAVLAVEQYLQAKVEGDDEAIRGLLCAEREGDLQQEASSFDAVEATIEGMACTRDGDAVRCEGAIVADYGGENTEFPLAAYRVVEEDGVWKWCGETE